MLRTARIIRPFASNITKAVTTDGPAAFTNYPQTPVSQIETGLRIGSEFRDTETVTVSVHVATGSRYETPEQNGVAHFCEHLFFKGTDRRSRVQLEREVEQLGGELNANTSREHTAFIYTVHKKDAEQAFDLLSDMILKSKFSDADVDRERDTILRENEHVQKDNFEVLFDRLHETAYRGVSLGRTILGPEENIRKFTSQDLRNWVNTNYVAPRMVIATAGALEHNKAVELSRKFFGSVPEKSSSPVPASDPAAFLGSEIRVRFDSMPEAHVAIGFPTAGFTDADHIPLMVIQQMIGSYTREASSARHSSSPLIADAAAENLAVSLNCFNTIYKDTGLFGVNFVAEKYALNDLMYLITRDLTSLSYDVDAKRLEEAKTSLKFVLLGQYERTAQVSDDIGRHIVQYGRRIHPAEIAARIDAVDARAIKQVANRFFYDRDFALAAIGPVWELPDYNWIRRRTYFLRY